MESAAPPAHRKKIGDSGARKFRLAQRRCIFSGGGGANTFPAGAATEFGG